MTSPRFSKDTLAFIEKAGRQKNPEWLERNREDYVRLVQAPLMNLAVHLKKSLSAQAQGYHFPQKGIGRLKRSADRAREYGSFYKNWIGYSASRPSGSRFDHNPSLFFMINTEDGEGDEVLLAGGLYMPSSRQLRAIREAIASDASAFDRLFASKAFSARFPGGFSKERTATRPPRGFDPKHPRGDWLKLQGYFVWRSYKVREFSSATFPETVAKDCQQLLRLNQLLEQVISGRASAPQPVKAKAAGLTTRLEEVTAIRRPMDF